MGTVTGRSARAAAIQVTCTLTTCLKSCSSTIVLLFLANGPLTPKERAQLRLAVESEAAEGERPVVAFVDRRTVAICHAPKLGDAQLYAKSLCKEVGWSLEGRFASRTEALSPTQTVMPVISTMRGDP